jgi:hypothetical protein
VKLVRCWVAPDGPNVGIGRQAVSLSATAAAQECILRIEGSG